MVIIFILDAVKDLSFNISLNKRNFAQQSEKSYNALDIWNHSKIQLLYKMIAKEYQTVHDSGYSNRL